MALALAALLAAVVAVVVVFPLSASADTTQTSSCTDKGEHLWEGRTVWGAEYRDAAGVKRIVNDSVAFTSRAPDATTVDYWVRVYDGAGLETYYSAESDRVFNFQLGNVYLSRNPGNPPSAPGRAKIVVGLGVGNDGFGNCTMTFVQPAAQSTPTPTPTTPKPTTPTPTPTAPTPSTPTGSVCTNPYFTTSGSNGGITNNGYYVHNNLWNAAGYPGTKGTTQVCSYRSWNHIGTATNTGDGAVKTYPNVHKDYSGRKISSFPRLTSTFAATSPGVGIYNVGYDLWLNGVPNDEVMIWTDNRNQVPAGSRVASNVTLGGYAWDVYATGGNGYIAFVPANKARITSGTLDLKAMLNYLVAQGRVAATATVDQICYGVEIVDTGGSPATWKFTDFSITDS